MLQSPGISPFFARVFRNRNGTGVIVVAGVGDIGSELEIRRA